MRLIVVGLVAAAALASVIPAQSRFPTLERLAVDWSARRDTMVCWPAKAPEGWGLAPELGECTWPAVSGGNRAWGQVTATRDPEDPEGAFDLILWQRSVADSSAARRLADSLSMALRSEHITEYACGGDDRRWQAPGFAVQFNVGAVFPDGLLRVMVSATTHPHELPSLTCPGAPTLSAPPRLPVRRGA